MALALPGVLCAEPAPIATLSAEAPISAGQGWLVWSVPVAGGWALDAYHAGHVQTLPVAKRRQPFDASVGSDAHGDPVVTFSRCRVAPKVGNAGLFVNGSGTLTEPNSGAGCRLRVLELDTMRESEPPIPAGRGDSDTTPAMWHGTVAFARKAPGHGRVSQVMLWSPAHPRQLTALPHGGVPEGCPHRAGCREFPPGGEVQSLALDGQLVAFVWRPEGPTVGFDGAWEERVDSLATRRGALAGTPILTESCTDVEEPGTVEEEWPSAPLLRGGSALFGELERGDCYRSVGGLLLEYAGGRRRIGHTPLATVELARDGETFYALVAQKPTSEQDPGCSPALPCTLQTFALPALKPSSYRPSHPFDY